MTKAGMLVTSDPQPGNKSGMKIVLQSTFCFIVSAELHRDCASHIQGKTSFLSKTSLEKSSQMRPEVYLPCDSTAFKFTMKNDHHSNSAVPLLQHSPSSTLYSTVHPCQGLDDTILLAQHYRTQFKEDIPPSCR